MEGPTPCLCSSQAASAALLILTEAAAIAAEEQEQRHQRERQPLRQPDAALRVVHTSAESVNESQDLPHETIGLLSAHLGSGLRNQSPARGAALAVADSHRQGLAPMSGGKGSRRWGREVDEEDSQKPHAHVNTAEGTEDERSSSGKWHHGGGSLRRPPAAGERTSTETSRLTPAKRAESRPRLLSKRESDDDLI